MITRRFAELAEWLAQGRLRLSVAKVPPLDQAGQAHRLLGGRGTVGKIVLIT
ncbi:zinc-binding dehydrogenase [Nitrospirillum sp. BR 11163]|uniref:zinc-binding dehydrogenase n=1 Tax=Nitrospirillum sp. BR 11163 TaxID=3104323 RepID=UPI003A4C6024